MYVIDITTMANFFGRITGITRVEHQLADRFYEMFSGQVRFVYWSNDKFRFEEYRGPLDFGAVKAARMSFDTSTTPNLPLARLTEGTGADNGTPTMVVSGSGWLQNRKYAAGCIALAQSEGLRLVVYIHDLIPIRFPHYYDAPYVRAFTESLTMIAASGALLACNSRNTQKDLLEWCDQRGLARPASVIAYLGDRIPVEPSLFEDAGDDDTDPPPAPFVLTVGAIHRRKNYDLLAAVWRRLAVRMGGRCPTLKIVGGVTTGGHDLANEIRNDPVLKSRVEILTDVDDTALDRLYRDCLLVAYPSHYEGWGLPVAEALAHGRICLASNVSAIPEIADLGQDLMAPDDPVSWASRILYYAQSQEVRARREAEIKTLYRPNTWEGTVDTIVQGAAEMPPAEAPELFPGDKVRIASPAAQGHFASMTYDVESWGRWARGRHMTLRFRMGGDTAAPDPLVLRATLDFPQPTTVRMVLNDQLVLERPALPGLGTYHAPLPEGCLAADNRLVIEAGSAFALPNDEKPAFAQRHSGVGLSEFGLFRPEHLIYDQRRGAGGVSGDMSVLRGGALSLVTGNMDKARLRSKDGLLAFGLNRSVAPGNTARATLHLEITDRKPAVLILRQNGQNLAAIPLDPDRRGVATAVFDLDESGLDRAMFDVLLLDPETMRSRKTCVVHDMFLPAGPFALATPEALATLPRLGLGDYQRFGKDTPGAMTDALCAGWDTGHQFGTITGHTGLISFRHDDDRPATSLKLTCKTMAPMGETPLSVEINGKAQPLRVTDTLKPYILPLPGEIRAGDPVTVRIATQGTAFLLRGLQTE